MLFTGDIASPDEQCSIDFYKSLKKHKELFKDSCLVANLEGLLSEKYSEEGRPVLSNHPSVIKSLKLMNTSALSIANNHALDLPEQFNTTKDILLNEGIKVFGGGEWESEAEEALKLEHDGVNYYLIGCSWDVMMQHQSNKPGLLVVNPIRPDRLLKQISELKETDPDAHIIIKIHWNFDLETVPFPAHRTLARAMIDAGAGAVIGCHSHCVQGGETYKNGVIIYGLGNFYFPWYKFSGGASYFPDWTRLELVFEWNPIKQKSTCHWFKYTYTPDEHRLDHVESEDFENGEMINSYSPYRGMEHTEYLKWYAENRRKDFLIPVYRHHDDKLRNSAIDYYMKKRIRFARFLAKRKLMGWHK